MGIFAKILDALAKIFTWWNGATIGTLVYTWRHGELVGEDAQGNRYYRSKPRKGARERRWVIYNGPNDSSRVPPEWHGWLHGAFDDIPQGALPPRRAWEAQPTPNATGTAQAFLPQGALERGARKVSDYEPWTPET